MIKVYLSGGLGNQLFQFATAYSLARRRNTTVVLDISNYFNNTRSYELEVFQQIRTGYRIVKNNRIFSSKLYKLLSTLLRSDVWREVHPFRYDAKILKCKKKCTLIGYFQSEKYFHDFRSELLEIFTFPDISDHHLLGIYKKILADKSSVSIHVRRGDYVSNPQANAYHGALPISYYKAAIDHMKLKIDKPNFYIFSDDISWIETHFDFLENYTIVDINKGADSYRDIQLMSICRGNIIANSSFSWWAAWLNRNTKKVVVAPKKWVLRQSEPLDDIIPQEWTTF